MEQMLKLTGAEGIKLTLNDGDKVRSKLWNQNNYYWQ